MNKTIRTVLIAAAGFLLFGLGGFYLGDLKSKHDEALGFYNPQIGAPTNVWETIGIILFVLSFACGIAAFRLWQVERTTIG